MFALFLYVVLLRFLLFEDQEQEKSAGGNREKKSQEEGCGNTGEKAADAQSQFVLHTAANGRDGTNDRTADDRADNGTESKSVHNKNLQK